ncbi:hypothetical protein DRO66_00370 [Candidatus Bathyarchaeota archaeon]|nr:MAG: hypothetical protein DRO66_00370 [Candidatus Bathyarchaeota archaeon]
MSTENTETLELIETEGGWDLSVQHDQTGSAYGCKLSESAYSQLKTHFAGDAIHYDSLQECCGKILDEIDKGNVPRRAIAGLRILMNRP